jgi:hypothetical protein
VLVSVLNEGSVMEGKPQLSLAVKESEQSEEGREKGPASSSTNDNNFFDSAKWRHQEVCDLTAVHETRQ